MNQKVGFSLKVVDDNNLSRLFPEVPGMTLRYTRCALQPLIALNFLPSLMCCAGLI